MQSDREDAALDFLVRCTIPQESPDFARPSRETIDAYLLGTAGEEERERMHLAMTRSAAFREEILELMEDLEQLASPETSRQFDAAFEERPASFGARREPAPRSHAPLVTSLWGLFRRPEFAYAVALVLAAILTYRVLLPPAGTVALHALPTGPPAIPAPSAATIAGVRVVDFPESAQTRGARPGERPIEIELSEGIGDLLLRLPIEPVAGDEKGTYAVEIREGPRLVLRQERTRGELLRDQIIPVVADADTFGKGGVYDVTVRYADRGHDLDHVVLFAGRIAIRRSAGDRRSEVAPSRP